MPQIVQIFESESCDCVYFDTGSFMFTKSLQLKILKQNAGLKVNVLIHMMKVISKWMELLLSFWALYCFPSLTLLSFPLSKPSDER